MIKHTISDFEYVEAIYSGGLAKRADEEGLASLSLPERSVLLAWWAKGEIDNGGFALLYSHDTDIDVIAAAFREVGCPDLAEACQASKNVFPVSLVPPTVSERTEYLDSSDDPWLPYDKVVWAQDRDFDRTVAQYIQENREYFIRYQKHV